jgi:hypothetical protein
MKGAGAGGEKYRPGIKARRDQLYRQLGYSPLEKRKSV